MVAPMKCLTAIAAFAVFALAATPHPSQAGFDVSVWYSEADEAQKSCVQSLQATAANARIPGLTIKVEARDSGAYPESAVLLVLNGVRWSAASALQVPQAFRDAAHFQAFTQSEVYKRLQASDRLRTDSPITWLAAAYGGFHQLFSRNRAITEPKHFYEQMIGGAEHARAYHRLKAESLSIVLGQGVQKVSFSDYDVAALGSTGSRMAGVEVPLVNALKQGLDRKARYINLTYSAVHPVIFAIGQEHRWQALPAAARKKVEQWVAAAAQHCSGLNFQREQEALAALKQSGLSVVPVNRAALVEPSWTHAMTWVIGNLKWTPQDLDDIVKVGEKPKRLPSALVAGFTAKERKELEAQIRTINAERKLILAAVQRLPLHDALRQQWVDGRDAIVAEFAAFAQGKTLPPPRMTPDGPRPKPKVMTPALARDILAELLKKAETDAPQCGVRCTDVVDAFCTAARVSWALGDNAAVRKHFDRAEEITRRSNSNSESLSQELMSIAKAKVLIGDAGAAMAIDLAAAFTLKRDQNIWTVEQLAKLAALAQSINHRPKSAELFTSALDAAGSNNGAVIRVADEHRNAGNMDVALSVLISAMESAGSPGDLYSAVVLGSSLWPEMADRAAALYDRLGDAQRPVSLRSENPNRPAIWDDMLDEDWHNHFKNSVWMWRWAKAPEQLAALKAKLQKYQKAAPPSVAEVLKFMNRDIDNSLAQVLFDRGDIAGSRAADGGAIARRNELNARAKDPAQGDAILVEAATMPKSSERDSVLWAVATAAAAASKPDLARRAIMQSGPSSLWDWRLAAIAASGIGY